ncbi:MAG: hypothetical protein ACI9EW_003358 [Cellvibrionaceae bacterium]|jgi:hypothetical protein
MEMAKFGNKQAERINMMTKERFLTVSWNNYLSLGLGVPTTIYVIIAFSTSLWAGRGGLIGLSVFGALF